MGGAIEARGAGPLGLSVVLDSEPPPALVCLSKYLPLAIRLEGDGCLQNMCPKGAGQTVLVSHVVTHWPRRWLQHLNTYSYYPFSLFDSSFTFTLAMLL